MDRWRPIRFDWAGHFGNARGARFPRAYRSQAVHHPGTGRCRCQSVLRCQGGLRNQVAARELKDSNRFGFLFVAGYSTCPGLMVNVKLIGETDATLTDTFILSHRSGSVRTGLIRSFFRFGGMPFQSGWTLDQPYEKISYASGRRRSLMPLWVSSQGAFRCWLIARFVAIRAISLTLLVGPLLAQQAEPADIPGQQTGMSTGVAHAPVKDALSRPITAGGFLDNAPVIFSDITHAAGLDKFHHKAGTPEKATILETPGSGVALLDYDNDGWLDIYLLNGSTFAALKGTEAPPRAMLLHNNHDGTFTDVTAKAGVANERWGFGVAVADYDNNGWPDIYVAHYGKNRLYHNNHDGTFTDVAENAGVTLGGWSTGPTWGDYDHDGVLDLFVPGYVRHDLDRPVFAGKGGVPA